MVVTNTGNVDLANVSLVDNLPAGLTYTSTVSNTCGGAVNANGNQITYGPFSLASGASCTIVLRVGRTAECAGQQTNNASVEGSFSSACVNGGEPIVVSDNASASILCGNVVCSIDAPDTRVCPGETVQICGPVGEYTLPVEHRRDDPLHHGRRRHLLAGGHRDRQRLRQHQPLLGDDHRGPASDLLDRCARYARLPGRDGPDLRPGRRRTRTCGTPARRPAASRSAPARTRW